ncbi:hypothetical protein LWI28_011559 [Acer negundo]|uniref:Uncharacterized protein n=1 Tax=Acer negundo TaxID=4023 RepID=A0AAD5IMA2_ACENE|nr:hypothetical protein LWI28_011559 [Acer negundo]
MHNANNDNEDENDGLSNVNKDGISQEVVVNIGSDSDNDVQRDPPNRGTAFIVGVDGRITIEVGQMFRGIPCKHAMVCITKTRDNVENYVDDYLKEAAYLKTFSNKIHAILDENLWPEGQFETVLPPIKRRRARRRWLSRKKGPNEPMRVQRLLALHLLCLKKFQKEKEMRMVPAQHSRLDSIHVGPAAVTSRNAGAVSGHGGNASNNSGPGTTIGLGGPSTCASGTITRVLWFPPTQEGNSIPRDATNNMSTQPFTQG